jgi:AcrR family transcriptional regulator
MEGVDAVSMRRIASELGSGPASLYRYVNSKDDLLSLMVEQIMGELKLPRPSKSWRADLRKIAFGIRAMVLSHPWMTSVSLFRPALGPNSLTATEATLRVLDGLGLPIDEMLVISNTVSTFARGYAAWEIAEHETALRSGLDREQWMASQAPYVGVIRESGKYPMFMRVIDDAKTPHDSRFMQKVFARGVEYILDGVAASVRQISEVARNDSSPRR